jgi:hypothetical protein
MRTTVRRFLAALATASLVSMMTTVQVAADANCDVGELCLWGNTGYGGDFWDPSHHDLNWPGAIANDDDSIKNKDNYRHLIYPDDSGGGALLYCIEPLEVEDDIAGVRDNNGQSNFQSSYTDCGSYPRP